MIGLARLERLAPVQRSLAGAPARHAIAVIVVAFAYVLQRAVWPYIPPSPHLLFYPAVFVAARLAGAGPGYLATALGTLAIAHGFLPPDGLRVATARDALDLLIFAGVGIGISAAVGRLSAALRREHDDALRARAAKESTDATWSMVAHDLRTPLNVIMLGSSELRRGANTPREMAKMLTLIQRSTDRASSLLKHALDAMKAAEGKLEVAIAPCDAAELCARAVDAVGLIATRKGVRLVSDVAAGAAVACDQPRVEQVLTNLLENAIKFTPKDGRVALAVDEAAGGVRFSVSDTGRGMAAGELDGIFGKFVGGREGGGHGLGLWIAAAILDAHGSTLTVESAEGRGTTFVFTLPIADAIRGSAEAGAPCPAS